MLVGLAGPAKRCVLDNVLTISLKVIQRAPLKQVFGDGAPPSPRRIETSQFLAKQSPPAFALWLSSRDCQDLAQGAPNRSHPAPSLVSVEDCHLYLSVCQGRNSPPIQKNKIADRSINAHSNARGAEVNGVYRVHG